jgi:hypothetical protein
MKLCRDIYIDAPCLTVFEISDPARELELDSILAACVSLGKIIDFDPSVASLDSASVHLSHPHHSQLPTAMALPQLLSREIVGDELDPTRSKPEPSAVLTAADPGRHVQIVRSWIDQAAGV